MANPEIHFVISAPRSGSTWLTTALNQHPEIFATEHRLFGDFCEVWQNNDGTTSPRITFDKYAQAFSVHYFYDALGMKRGEFLNAFEKSFANFLVGFATRRTDKKFVIDKITPYPGTAKLVVEKIRRLFPDSKIIQLVRDGRDVLTSGTYDWLLKDAAGSDRYRYHVDQEEGFELKRFFDDAVIEKWASNWCETIDAFREQKADAQVRYESMKDDLPKEIARIVAAIGADPSGVAAASGKVSFEQMTGRKEGDDSQPTAKARKGIVGDWRNHFTVADGELFDSICGTQLVGLGYEADRSWVNGLPVVLK
ncbi:sulfotransferase domain-containing protein [Mariniblastus fucicola]|nr:sulfotransferase domain-containing protein [Mariniblastus fucicola]